MICSTRNYKATLLALTVLCVGQAAHAQLDEIDFLIAGYNPIEQRVAYANLLEKAERDVAERVSLIERSRMDLARATTESQRSVARTLIRTGEKNLAAAQEALRTRTIDLSRATQVARAITTAPLANERQILEAVREADQTRLAIERHRLETHKWELSTATPDGRSVPGAAIANARAANARKGVELWNRLARQEKAIRKLGGAFPIVGIGTSMFFGVASVAQASSYRGAVSDVSAPKPVSVEGSNIGESSELDQVIESVKTTRDRKTHVVR